MKKKFMLVPMVALLALGLTACGTKDSQGKEFKASLAKSSVMMDSDYTATAKLKTNKNATYTIENSKGNEIQGERKIKTGKADIELKKTGKYTIVAKSDNGHVTKNLPLTVKPYEVTLNKATNSVGPLQFVIKSIKYQEMTKTKEPNNDALFNMDNYASLNKHYYQVVINYEVRNNGEQPVDVQSTSWTPTDDNGTEYQDDGSADSYFYDTVVGGSKIAPKQHRAGSIYMISNNKFSVNNLKFNVSEIWAKDDDKIGDGGVAQLN